MRLQRGTRNGQKDGSVLIEWRRVPAESAYLDGTPICSNAAHNPIAGSPATPDLATNAGRTASISFTFRLTFVCSAHPVVRTAANQRLCRKPYLSRYIAKLRRQPMFTESVCGETPHNRTPRSRNAFPTTETELKLIAAAAIMGLSRSPKNG